MIGGQQVKMMYAYNWEFGIPQLGVQHHRGRGSAPVQIISFISDYFSKNTYIDQHVRDGIFYL